MKRLRKLAIPTVLSIALLGAVLLVSRARAVAACEALIGDAVGDFDYHFGAELAAVVPRGAFTGGRATGAVGPVWIVSYRGHGGAINPLSFYVTITGEVLGSTRGEAPIQLLEPQGVKANQTLEAPDSLSKKSDAS